MALSLSLICPRSLWKRFARQLKMSKKRTRAPMQWRTMDLHLHTPASGDFLQPEVSYLEFLQRAESRGLDIISITDHNTVAGYRRIREEIQQLELLENLNRL